MEEDEYLWKKAEETTITDNGEESTVSRLLFGMTSDHIEYRDEDTLRKIELDSIKKMSMGDKPYPGRIRLVLEDGKIRWIPEWAVDEFTGLAQRIAEHAGLEKTQGPRIEVALADTVERSTGISVGAVLGGTIVVVGLVGLVLTIYTPLLCFIPFWILGGLALIWLVVLYLKSRGTSRHVWKRK